MTDIFSKEKRSWLMSRVLPKGNRSTEGRFTEILRRKKTKRLASRSFALWKAGFCFYKSPYSGLYRRLFFGTVVLYTVKFPPPIAIVGERKLAVIAKEISE